MYAITYTLFTGTVIHRAPSAKAALEAMGMLRMGGATVLKIEVTRNGEELSVEELRRRAEKEP